MHFAHSSKDFCVGRMSTLPKFRSSLCCSITVHWGKSFLFCWRASRLLCMEHILLVVALLSECVSVFSKRYNTIEYVLDFILQEIAFQLLPFLLPLHDLHANFFRGDWRSCFCRCRKGVQEGHLYFFSTFFLWVRMQRSIQLVEGRRHII